MSLPRPCMLLARFHPVRGGTEEQALRLSAALREAGAAAFVLTARLPGLPASEAVAGVPVARLAAPGRGLLSSAAFAVGAFGALLRRRRDYDLVHAHLAGSHVLAALAARAFTGAPVVVKLGGGRATGDIGTALARPWGRWKLRVVARRADLVAAPAREVLEEAAAHGFARARLRLVPNGVDTGRFRPAGAAGREAARARLGLPADAPVGIFTGRIEPGKGLEALLAAWPAADPDAILLVAGDGSLRAGLERAHAGARVRFLGALADVRPALAAADAFLLPSAGEGLSNALLEAMAAGLAPLVSDIPANREAVDDGRTGLVGSYADPAAARDALRAAFAARERWPALGAAARREAEARFSLTLVRDAWLALYRELLAARR